MSSPDQKRNEIGMTGAEGSGKNPLFSVFDWWLMMGSLIFQ